MIQLFRNKRPSVVAGLAAAFTLSSLGAPGAALAVEAESLGTGGAPVLEQPAAPQEGPQGAGALEGASQDNLNGGSSTTDEASNGADQSDDDLVVVPTPALPSAPPSSSESAHEGDSEAQVLVDVWFRREDGSWGYKDAKGDLFLNGWVTTASLPGGGSGPIRRYWVSGGQLVESGWIVTDLNFENQSTIRHRYWIDPAVSALPASGLKQIDSGVYIYVTSFGYVAEGKFVDPLGRVFLAKSDGVLESGNAEGWVVTDRYDGSMQRYHINQRTRACDTGFFDAPMDGVARKFFGSAEGYVRRGKTTLAGAHYLADDAGAFQMGNAEGWVVSNRYDGAWRRYGIDRSTGACRTGLFQALMDGKSEWFYGERGGYVAQGKRTGTDGSIYLANHSNGVLESGNAEGWVVTDRYDGSMRRYHINQRTRACDTGFFDAPMDGTSRKFFAIPEKGYTVTGRERYMGGMVIASNAGILYLQDAKVNEFIWTSELDGRRERYYVITLNGGVKGAKLGLFKIGNDQYYGREDKGYLVRGQYTAPDGRIFRADDDGKLSYSFLTKYGWAAWDKLIKRGEESRTQYLIIVDNTGHRTIVFQGVRVASGFFGNWTPLYDWSCSTGSKIYHGGEGTPHGIYRIGGNADYNWEPDGDYTPGGYRTKYWAKNDVKYFTGFLLNLGFHSTVGYQGGYSDTSQLGKSVSHGCIRLAEEAASWIYHNALPGTKVWVY